MLSLALSGTKASIFGRREIEGLTLDLFISLLKQTSEVSSHDGGRHLTCLVKVITSPHGAGDQEF